MASMTPIAELIEEVRALNGWSYRDLERRSRGVVSKSRFQQFVYREMRSLPEARTINGVAQALGLPVSIVVERMLATLGIPRPSGSGEPQPPEVAIEADEHLDRESKDLLLATLRKLRERGWWDPQQRGGPPLRRAI